jgi:hypothetical protein
MIHAALSLILLAGLTIPAAPVVAGGPLPGTPVPAIYQAAPSDQAAVTPVRWYGYYGYPRSYWYPGGRYYTYRPYYGGYYYPRRYYDYDYSYPGYGYGYDPYRGYNWGPRSAYRFRY